MVIDIKSHFNLANLDKAESSFSSNLDTSSPSAAIIHTRTHAHNTNTYKKTHIYQHKHTCSRTHTHYAYSHTKTWVIHNGAHSFTGKKANHP